MYPGRLMDLREKLILISKNKMASEGYSKDEYFDPQDVFGGNFDDAYNGGFDDGAINLARHLLKDFFDIDYTK